MRDGAILDWRGSRAAGRHGRARTRADHGADIQPGTGAVYLVEKPRMVLGETGGDSAGAADLQRPTRGTRRSRSSDGIFDSMIDSKQVRKLPLPWLLALLVAYLAVIGPLDQVLAEENQPADADLGDFPAVCGGLFRADLFDWLSSAGGRIGMERNERGGRGCRTFSRTSPTRCCGEKLTFPFTRRSTRIIRWGASSLLPRCAASTAAITGTARRRAGLPLCRRAIGSMPKLMCRSGRASFT